MSSVHLRRPGAAVDAQEYDEDVSGVVWWLYGHGVQSVCLVICGDLGVGVGVCVVGVIALGCTRGVQPQPLARTPPLHNAR